MEQEVVRLMDQALILLEESIKDSPGEWLWQHNRWKQQTPRNIYKPFRHDCVCIILPQEERHLEALTPHLPTLSHIYEGSFLIFIIPEKYREMVIAPGEAIYYHDMKETLIKDYRFKLVFNFTDYRSIDAHYKSLSAFDVLDLAQLKKLAKPHLSDLSNLSDVFLRALCRPDCTLIRQGK
jgi:hypothetical protein